MNAIIVSCFVLGIGMYAVGLVLYVKGIRIASGARRCASCDYILHGHPKLPDRCPECGKSVEEAGIVRVTREDNRPLRAVAIGLILFGTVLVFTGIVLGSN